MAIGTLNVLNSRLVKGLLAFIIIAVFGVWFYLNDQKVRKEAWKGVVAEKWEKKPMLRGVSVSDQAKQNRRTMYYWRVTKEDGTNAEVKVPFTLYTSGNPGTRIEKIYSERYPRIAQ